MDVLWVASWVSSMAVNSAVRWVACLVAWRDMKSADKMGALMAARSAGNLAVYSVALTVVMTVAETDALLAVLSVDDSAVCWAAL